MNNHYGKTPPDDILRPSQKVKHGDFLFPAHSLFKSTLQSPVIDPSALNSGNTRCQDLPSAYHPNGSIYVRNIKDLMDPRLKTLYQGARPYIMDKILSIDVDTKTDFIFAEAILSSGSHQ